MNRFILLPVTLGLLAFLGDCMPPDPSEKMGVKGQDLEMDGSHHGDHHHDHHHHHDDHHGWLHDCVKKCEHWGNSRDNCNTQCIFKASLTAAEKQSYSKCLYRCKDSGWLKENQCYLSCTISSYQCLLTCSQAENLDPKCPPKCVHDIGGNEKN